MDLIRFLGGPVLGIFDVSIFTLTGPEAAALINAHSTPDDILQSTGHNWVGISAIQNDDGDYVMTVILVHACHGSDDSGAQTHSAASNCSYFLEDDATRKAELDQCFGRNQIDPLFGKKFKSEGRWYSSSLNPASSIFQMPVFTGGNDNAYWCANNAITAEDETEVGSLLLEVSTQTCEWNVLFDFNDADYFPEEVSTLMLAERIEQFRKRQLKLLEGAIVPIWIRSSSEEKSQVCCLFHQGHRKWSPKPGL
eukprot:TRINITY_DN3090_c0_g1_i2.p1 TRINITY_DN3090_c0_g1~~TRINITY_DN3090_c0_g1_i2.p1  ORF type:complete len:252 (+),score=42.00 TRINITY_DN3090_c0_g1_i2:143-898(+)